MDTGSQEGKPGESLPKPGSTRRDPLLSPSIINILITVLLAIAFVLLYEEVIMPRMQSSVVQEGGDASTRVSFPIAKIFAMLFLMLGPFKIIGPFGVLTRGMDLVFSRRIALFASGFACLALLFAAFLGGTILKRFGIPLPVLAMSGGVILLVVALISIVQQFKPATLPEEKAPPQIMPKAASFAFPTIVTPYGIAALVIFLALARDLQTRLAIGAIVLAILMLNLISMLLVPFVYRILGIFLQILAAVLSVIQVALGIQIIVNSLKAMQIMT